MAHDIDPTRLEVVRNALEGIADTMAISLYQTARSAVVRLGWYFSTAVLAADGDLAGQGTCHPIHLGGMMPALAPITITAPPGCFATRCRRRPSPPASSVAGASTGKLRPERLGASEGSIARPFA